MTVAGICLLVTLLQVATALRFGATNTIVLNAIGSHKVSQPFTVLGAVQRDEKGYEIKPRDWFNGLSKDPGASLTDPRAVPPECREFAESIKSNSGKTSLKESIALIDKHYNYFSVSWTTIMRH